MGVDERGAMGTESKPNTNDEDVATPEEDGRWDSRSESSRAASNEIVGRDVALASPEVEDVDEAWKFPTADWTGTVQPQHDYLASMSTG